MEAGSVSSSVNAALAAGLQAQVRARQPEQNQQAQQSQQTQQTEPSEQARRTQQVQLSPSVDEGEAASQALSEAETIRPTVNANGQTVGARVNTTA